MASEFERQQGLYAEKVTSSREFEAAQAASSTAVARVHEAEARLALLAKGPTRRDNPRRTLASGTSPASRGVDANPPRLWHATYPARGNRVDRGC